MASSSNERKLMPELTIIDKRVEITSAGAIVQVTVQNTGKSQIEHGEILLEWFDNISENKARTLTFRNLKPNQIALAVTKCEFKPEGKERYFYFNLSVGKVY
jgi:hypothetical protein